MFIFNSYESKKLKYLKCDLLNLERWDLMSEVYVEEDIINFLLEQLKISFKEKIK